MRNKPLYNYKHYVDIGNISIDQEIGYRYSLYVPFKNPTSTKCVLVIMRNPSKADKSKSDKTINNVLSFCYGKYKGVCIANLYPCYKPDPKQIKEFASLTLYEEKMKKNYEAIDKLLLEDIDDIIVAWGTNNSGLEFQLEYERVVKLISDKLHKANKNIYAMRFVSSRNPWHPRNWEENFEFELYKWEK